MTTSSPVMSEASVSWWGPKEVAKYVLGGSSGVIGSLATSAILATYGFGPTNYIISGIGSLLVGRNIGKLAVPEFSKMDGSFKDYATFYAKGIIRGIAIGAAVQGCGFLSSEVAALRTDSFVSTTVMSHFLAICSLVVFENILDAELNREKDSDITSAVPRPSDHYLKKTQVELAEQQVRDIFTSNDYINRVVEFPYKDQTYRFRLIHDPSVSPDEEVSICATSGIRARYYIAPECGSTTPSELIQQIAGMTKKPLSRRYQEPSESFGCGPLYIGCGQINGQSAFEWLASRILIKKSI